VGQLITLGTLLSVHGGFDLPKTGTLFAAIEKRTINKTIIHLFMAISYSKETGERLKTKRKRQHVTAPLRIWGL